MLVIGSDFNASTDTEDGSMCIDMKTKTTREAKDKVINGEGRANEEIKRITLQQK